MNFAFFNSIKDGKIDKRPYQAPAYLKAYIDQQVEDKIRFDIIMELDDFDPSEYDICGISTVSTEYNDAVQIARKIKAQKEIPVIIGGVHISSAPDSLDPVFDLGVIGEGEETLKEVLTAFQHGSLSPDRLKKIPGLVYHQNGVVQTSGTRTFMDLEKLPDPDWSHIYAHGSGEPILVSSRGCPYKCHFCASAVVSRGRLRLFSIDQLLCQIRMCLEQNPYATQLSFSDDHFFTSKARVREFISKINQESFPDKITFNGNCRSGSVDSQMCTLMNEAKFKSIQIGFESASDKLLKSMNKRVTAEQNIQAIEMLNEYGIEVSITSIIGFPDEDEKDLALTYDVLLQMIKDGILAHVGISILMPYPATYYWNEAIKHHRISLPFDWRRLKHSAFRTEFHDASEEYARIDLDFTAAFEQWWKKRTAAETIYIGSIPELRLKELMYHYQLKIYHALVQRSPMSRRIHQSLEVIQKVASRADRTYAIYGMGFLTEKIVRYAKLDSPTFLGFTDSKDYAVESGNYFSYPCYDRRTLLEKAPHTIIVSAYSHASMASIATTINELGFNGEIVTVHNDVDS